MRCPRSLPAQISRNRSDWTSLSQSRWSVASRRVWSVAAITRATLWDRSEGRTPAGPCLDGELQGLVGHRIVRALRQLAMKLGQLHDRLSSAHQIQQPLRARHRRLAKRFAIAIDRLDVGVLQGPGIILAAHAEVREVIQKSAKDRLAVLSVGSGVEDVLVPHLV